MSPWFPFEAFFFRDTCARVLPGRASSHIHSHPAGSCLGQVTAMLLFLLLLCCAALGGSFAPNVALPASRCALGWHDAGRCHVSRSWRASPWSASRASSGVRRVFAISREMSVRADDGGRGDTHGEKSAIAATEAKIEAVEGEIRAVGQKIEKVEAALSGGPPYLGISDPDLLWDDLKQLRKKEEQLLDGLKQLRELMLRQLPAQASFLTSASKNVTGFAAAFTGAAVTDNTLELANDTFFLGDSKLGSKLFIRPCYKELSEIILSGASSGTSRNIVVTGTPGIGKSVFGCYLLYLLRCQGKTVVFERKGRWYRFSDEGVKRGEYSDFFRAGYLEDDPTAWYLSDPDDRPKEMFDGTTVVLVSPKVVRVNEFMKQPKSLKLFMPVWSKDELLKCRGAVFPDVPSTDVEKAFGVVGGVARAIFDVEKFGQMKRNIEDNVRGVDVGSLRAAASGRLGRMSTDDLGDSVFHIFLGRKKYRDYSVTYASDFAKDLVVKEISKMEARALAGFVGAAIREPELGEILGKSVIGSLFEMVAHVAICGDPGLGETPAERRFNMRVLTHGGSKDIVGRDFLSFSFTRPASFRGGNAFPARFDLGPYYVPESPNFAAIDSFGVDSSGLSSVLCFFQVKSAGFKAEGGPKLEEYWNVARSKAPSIKRCVFVYAVPAGEQWHKATKLRGRDWLEGATDGFKAVCDVCVIEIPLQNY